MPGMTYTRKHAPLPHLYLQAYSFDAERFTGGDQSLFDLAPEYQRGSVWTLEQRRNLIRSLIMGLPIGSIVLNDRSIGDNIRVFGNDAIFGVIDGKQRIETMRAWASDEFSVPADWFDDKDITPEAVDSDGMITMSGLSARGRRIAARWPMPTVQTSVATLAAEAEVFRLLNSAGTQQTDDDMARAAHVEGH